MMSEMISKHLLSKFLGEHQCSPLPPPPPPPPLPQNKHRSTFFFCGNPWSLLVNDVLYILISLSSSLSPLPFLSVPHSHSLPLSHALLPTLPSLSHTLSLPPHSLSLSLHPSLPPSLSLYFSCDGEVACVCRQSRETTREMNVFLRLMMPCLTISGLQLFTEN